MADTADKVTVELEAKIDGYQQKIGQGANAFEQAMARMQGSATKTEKAVDSINRSVQQFKGIEIGRLLLGAAERALQYASSLAETAQQLGVSAKALQVYRYAASQVGISNDEMDSGLRRLTSTLGKAELGAEGPTKALTALSHVLGKDILTSAKSTEDRLLLIADALAKIPDPTKRAAFEMELFSRTGQKLDTLLAGGSKAINELAESAEKLGLVLSDEQIQNADRTADKLSELKQVLEARVAGAVADNAQSILSLANALATLVGRMAQFWAQHPHEVGAALGAMAGSRFGLPGAAVGAIVGAFATSDTPQSLLGAANVQQAEARRIAASHGYVHGRNSARDQEILKLPDVQQYLTRARELIGRAAQAARSGSIAATPGAPSVPDIPVDKFLSPNAKKGPKGPSDESLKKEALRTQYDMDRDQLDGQRDILQAQSDLSDSYEERADQARQIADVEMKQKDRTIQFDLDMVLADTTISAKQKEEAKLRADKAHKLADDLHVIDLQNIENQRALDRQKSAQALEDQAFDQKKDILQAESQIAQTAGERRKIELELLDLTYQQRRNAAQHIRDDMKPNGSYSHSEDERNRAISDLKSMDATYGAARQGVMQSTRGPLEQYLASIPDTAEKANEALQAVAAQGLQSISDGLVDAITHAKNLGQVFSSVAKQILADLLKLQIEKSIIGPLGKLLGITGATNALTGSGRSFMSAGDFASGIIPGRASGGNVSAGQLYHVNEAGVEGFRPAGSGTIIPLGQMAQTQGGASITSYTVHVHATDAVLAETVRGWVTQGMQEAAARGAIGGRTLTLDRLRRQSSRRLA